MNKDQRNRLLKWKINVQPIEDKGAYLRPAYFTNLDEVIRILSMFSPSAIAYFQTVDKEGEYTYDYQTIRKIVYN